MTEVLIIIVMRTWKPFYKSMPSRSLLVAMIMVLLVTLALPYSPLKGVLGFTPLPISSLMLLGLITIFYAGVSEITKRVFHARVFGKEMTLAREGL
jgi:Mg2+-importing ATPase